MVARTPGLVRIAAFLALTVAVGSGLSACDPRSDPITPRGAGFQQTADGDLEIWFGGPCRDVVEVEIGLVEDGGDDAPLEYVQRAPGYVPSVELPAVAPERGSGLAALPGLTLGEPVDGLLVESPLPDGVDWHDFATVRLRVKTSAGQASTYLEPERLVRESDDHPGDYYVQDQGWFDEAAFDEASGGDFEALCSSINPAED